LENTIHVLDGCLFEGMLAGGIQEVRSEWGGIMVL